jgi:hypothetical protein
VQAEADVLREASEAAAERAEAALVAAHADWLVSEPSAPLPHRPSPPAAGVAPCPSVAALGRCERGHTCRHCAEGKSSPTCYINGRATGGGEVDGARKVWLGRSVGSHTPASHSAAQARPRPCLTHSRATGPCVQVADAAVDMAAAAAEAAGAGDSSTTAGPAPDGNSASFTCLPPRTPSPSHEPPPPLRWGLRWLGPCVQPPPPEDAPVASLPPADASASPLTPPPSKKGLAAAAKKRLKKLFRKR